MENQTELLDDKNDETILKTVNRAMFEDVHDFLEENFFPCAPISKCLGMSQSKYFWNWAWVETLLMEEEALAAVDEEDNILGVIIGKHSVLLDMTTFEWIIDFFFGGGWEEFLGGFIWKLCWILNWILPEYYGEHTHGIFSKLFDRLGFNENMVMSSLGCEKLYTVAVLCVRVGDRGRGLGSKLVREGEKRAKKRSCDCSAVIVSNLYSERIFRKLNYSMVREVSYDQFRDKKGQRYFKDTGEHQMITFLVKTLGKEKV